RIALSATVHPAETVAAFIGGFRKEGDEASPSYVPRKVGIIRSPGSKSYDIRIRHPKLPEGPADEASFWEPFVSRFLEILRKNRSTLIFVNSRRLSERITLKINEAAGETLAYAHHGSLSREIRGEVEKKLKNGGLRAVVATNSLELGIDIGSLDEVILVQSPASVSSALQRIGRSGHRVGDASRATLFPTNSQDILESAVLCSAIQSRDIEETAPVECALDVLSQVILSMTGTEIWDINALYNQIRAGYPYRNLGRKSFDLVLDMLAGRYQDSRIRELRQRVSIDRIDRTVSARPGALMDLYLSSGVIPDRGLFTLRHAKTGSRIGDLDEEFVWEAKIGQSFSLGTQQWKIQRITHSDVWVESAPAGTLSAPFWKAEPRDRDFHFSEALAGFLEDADSGLEDVLFSDHLQKELHLDENAALSLAGYLKKQKMHTGCSLPHRHHLVVESIRTGPGGAPGNQVVLHTFWGGRVNRPFAMALDAAWEERYDYRLEMYAGNDCIVLQLPHDLPGEELLSLVNSGNLESLLKKSLEGSGFFGARFRENAGRALLLAKKRPAERTPLWMNRLRSQKLLAAVSKYGDFPILLETWRTCLRDEFDIPALNRMLSGLESGEIKVSFSSTDHPSPMAAAASWRQINDYMYRSDAPEQGGPSGLKPDLLRELVLTPGLRPQVSVEIVSMFEQKRQRLHPGYSPATGRDLVDWVKERVVIPEPEWESLLKAVRRDHVEAADGILAEAGVKLVRIFPAGARHPLIAALERTRMILSVFYPDPAFIRLESVSGEPGLRMPEPAHGDRQDTAELRIASLLGEWMQYYGPLSFEFIRDTLGLDREILASALQDLAESETVVFGSLVSGADEELFCDSTNLETLLRMARAGAVPAFEPLDAAHLPLFLAAFQGLTGIEDSPVGLKRSIEKLICFPVPAKSWESDIFPSRLPSYHPDWMNSLIRESELRWIGHAGQKISFCFEPDLDLTGSAGADKKDDDPGIPARIQSAHDLFPDPAGKYDFPALLQSSGLGSSELSGMLWKMVWGGQVSNDTFTALRKGIQNRFQVPDAAAGIAGPGMGSRRFGNRARFSKWKSAIPFSGAWFRLRWPGASGDLLEIEELKKDRVRLLLDRYGILFRELLSREMPQFRWSGLFRTLRIMELSGEILSGYFFREIPGPQFMSHEAFRFLKKGLPGDRIYWMNAADPASCCGLSFSPFRDEFPRRVENTHLVFQGSRLVLESLGQGKNLIFHVPPDDANLHHYFALFRHLLSRTFEPLVRITIKSINGERPDQSPYLPALKAEFGTSAGYKEVILYKRN
ncbi:ATP-dependent helicase, partial [bacterium]|nr:ATP-dependent helicase [bacterium]